MKPGRACCLLNKSQAVFLSCVSTVRTGNYGRRAGLSPWTFTDTHTLHLSVKTSGEICGEISTFVMRWVLDRLKKNKDVCARCWNDILTYLRRKKKFTCALMLIVKDQASTHLYYKNAKQHLIIKPLILFTPTNTVCMIYSTQRQTLVFSYKR